MAFGLRSGLKVESTCSGPIYPRSQIFETYAHVRCYWGSRIKRNVYLPQCGRTETSWQFVVAKVQYVNKDEEGVTTLIYKVDDGLRTTVLRCLGLFRGSAETLENRRCLTE